MRLQQIFIFFVACCLQTSILWGQDSSIIGVVTDENNIPIPFANVVLKDTASKIISGTITEDSGAFIFDSLEDGSYKLNVSFIGYQDYESNVITLSRKLQLPTIQLLENTESLDEVTLTAKRPVITRESDRLVFNVENSTLSNGSTMDILKRTPGVVVNQEKIMIRNEGVTVYLNNRRVPLDNQEVQALLDNLGGDVIKSIEVIQNPPAEYEAEGGPVLNIITTKSVSVGYKGSLNANGTYSIFPKHTFGTSHFFKSEKVDLFVNYSFNPRKTSHRTLGLINYENEGVGTLWDQDYERKEWRKAHNTTINLDYKATDKTTFSFSGMGLFSPNELSAVQSITEVQPGNENQFVIGTNSSLDSERFNIALDAGILHSLKKGSISANVHYTTFDLEKSQDLRSVYRDTQSSVFRIVSFANAALQDIDIYTGKIDYSARWGKVDFQTGAKISVINSRSKIDFLSIQDDGNSGLDQAQNDDFFYDENVIAGYLSLARDWEKWSAKVGLRTEQTNSKGSSVALDQINELDYLEWFPTAYLQYQPADKHSFSLDYSRRLDRPRYQDLNPFSYFLNENNFNQGNANLIPAFSNRFNFNYSFNNQYFFDIYYRDNGENIVILPFQDNINQVLRTDRQNALDSKSWGIDIIHVRSLASWFNFQTYISAFHEEETFLAIESGDIAVTNEVDGLYAYLSNNLTLSKDKTFTGNVTFEYLSKFLSGSYQQESTTSINVGLRKSLWNNRGVVNININDLLNRANARLSSLYLNQNNSYRVFNETQNLQIGFTYKFGNFRIEDNKKVIDKEERDRLGKGD